MKIRLLAAAAVAALAVAGLSVPAPALAAGTGNLTVQVVTPNGAPLQVTGLNIQVYEGNDFNTGGNTDSSGKLPFSGIPASSKIRVVYIPASGSGYLSKTLTNVKLSTGQTKTVDIVAAKGATVSGKITAGSAQTALNGADVALLTSKGYVADYATSDSSGDFTISGIASGSYRIQFNTRQEHITQSAQTSFAWSYWAGTGKASTLKLASGKKLKVSAQTAHAPASAITGITGSVSNSILVNGAVSYWSPASGHAGQRVDFVATTAADSFSTLLNSAGQLATPVVPGKYKISIQGDEDTILAVFPEYWYVSNTKGPAATESKASWVTVGTSSKSIAFIQAPSSGSF